MGEEKPLEGSRPAEGEGDILNVLIVLLKRKTMILGIPLALVFWQPSSAFPSSYLQR